MHHIHIERSADALTVTLTGPWAVLLRALACQLESTAEKIIEEALMARCDCLTEQEYEDVSKHLEGE